MSLASEAEDWSHNYAFHRFPVNDVDDVGGVSTCYYCCAKFTV